METLKMERDLYFPNSPYISIVKLFLLSDHDYWLWIYQKSLRYTEYHFNTRHKLRFYLWERRKNRLGRKLGITIWHNTIGKGLRIWHYGSIIVNGHSNIGENCRLHGNNCIGNKGDTDLSAPTIGDNADIGVGACVIGPVVLANDVIIGANAVVTKSFTKNRITLIGIPAREK